MVERECPQPGASAGGWSARPGAHDLVFPGVTVAGASDLGILADTAFERRVYAVHGLPTSGNSNAHP